MLSYTSFDWMPNEVAEYCYGKDVARAGLVTKHGTSWSILDGGEQRQASPNEAEGIEAGLAKFAEAVAFFTDEVDDIESMLLADEADWMDCHCVTPEQSCPTCRMAARYAYVSEQAAYAFPIM